MPIHIIHRIKIWLHKTELLQRYMGYMNISAYWVLIEKINQLTQVELTMSTSNFHSG